MGGRLMKGDEIYTHHAGTRVGQCTFCRLSFAGSTVTEARLAMLLHLARFHPEQYVDAFHEEPTTESIQKITYRILEGISS